MDKKYADRLLKLADFLETLPNEKFRFATWYSGPGELPQFHECGTTACAFGWACSIPEFRALGLHLRWDDNWGAMRPVTMTTNSPERAAEEFFGLDNEGFHQLFIPRDNNAWDDVTQETLEKMLPESATAKEVAANIRDYVKENYG